jgi:UDP-N-acetylglucosamine 2-epimerase (non-hydrolysing)
MGKRVLLVVGTRPEAIKMAPLAKAMRDDARFSLQLCFTGQHKEMIDGIARFFEIEPDFDLEIMKRGQDLYDITTAVLIGLRSIFEKERPDVVCVHGDTTTCLAGALASFYARIPVAHVEAGLRTYTLDAPFPEEANRQLVSRIANFHFAPTERAKANLLSEGIKESQILVSGNTVIDALLWAKEKIDCGKNSLFFGREIDKELASILQNSRRPMILITGHRRENFGSGLEQICRALRKLADRYPDVCFVYPVHMNPNVREPVQALLGSVKNIFLLAPQEYPTFVWLMNRSTLILTDSGGIQEEAPSLQKPVLVMRETTERPEAIESGAVKLVGTDQEAIYREVCFLLEAPDAVLRMTSLRNPFGDGRAASRICDYLADKLGRR